MIDRVDERGEVALLTRNIKIEGELEHVCPTSNGNCKAYSRDTFGGHFKVGYKPIYALWIIHDILVLIARASREGSRLSLQIYRLIRVSLHATTKHIYR